VKCDSETNFFSFDDDEGTLWRHFCEGDSRAGRLRAVCRVEAAVVRVIAKSVFSGRFATICQAGDRSRQKCHSLPDIASFENAIFHIVVDDKTRRGT